MNGCVLNICETEQEDAPLQVLLYCFINMYSQCVCIADVSKQKVGITGPVFSFIRTQYTQIIWSSNYWLFMPAEGMLS